MSRESVALSGTAAATGSSHPVSKALIQWEAERGMMSAGRLGWRPAGSAQVAVGRSGAGIFIISNLRAKKLTQTVY
jgi:hypothetical protein